MKLRLLAILCVLFTLLCSDVHASHIVGGEFTYTYLGDSASGGFTFYKYQVNLSIYEDCLTGDPEAIAQDNPAFFSAYNMQTGLLTELDTNIFYISSIQVPINFSNSCISNIPATCVLKKTFSKVYAFKANPAGYLIVYQRCCRNASIVNIQNPGNAGSTYYATIPPTALKNNSAVFKNYPPQIICLNNPLYYDNSATDADAGDSLSYGFTSALEYGDPSNVKPYPNPPPYDSVTYIPPYSPQVPFTGFPPIQINPATGLITGTPNRIGRYLVAVYCHEWRGGVIINTIQREFQFVVTDCSKTVVADIPQYSTQFNTYIVDCQGYNVSFVNTSKGGFAYGWNFGVPGTNADTSNAFQPTFTYPDTGTYTVKLVVNPGSTCPDSISRFVKVYPKFTAAFSDSGQQCPGSPINFTDLSSASVKPINYWKWNFGDGDSSFTENPVHTYSVGGTFNAILVSQTSKGCIDTAFHQVIIETFKPFAGNDTIIVKGSDILFNAIGGISYSWSPSTNLNYTDIYNPLGTYPDTGTFIYDVHVTSDYGCSGDDTIKVLVVANAEFVVPSAFTPNGDGKDDYFRPIAVGYSTIKYFRVFNRYGQRVFSSNSFEVGWDGTFNNARADIGTYYWEISFTDRYGKDGVMKGDVTLIR